MLRPAAGGPPRLHCWPLCSDTWIDTLTNNSRSFKYSVVLFPSRELLSTYFTSPICRSDTHILINKGLKESE